GAWELDCASGFCWVWGLVWGIGGDWDLVCASGPVCGWGLACAIAGDANAKELSVASSTARVALVMRPYPLLVGDTPLRCKEGKNGPDGKHFHRYDAILLPR